MKKRFNKDANEKYFKQSIIENLIFQTIKKLKTNGVNTLTLTFREENYSSPLFNYIIDYYQDFNKYNIKIIQNPVVTGIIMQFLLEKFNYDAAVKMLG